MGGRMTYLEARNSGYPFNRRKYKDGWYVHDKHRNVDCAMLDLSQRFWSEDDLAADDWWTTSKNLQESIDNLLNETGWDD